ncbi:MAG: DUF6288 domain-containing protein [Phycisphaeraceae bacterium]
MLKRILSIAVVFALLFAGPAIANDATPPDLTAGGQRAENAKHDWNLGATGARGWIHSYKMHTTEARQILVTKVAEDSPADGKLRVGDVIVGINGELFDSDARAAFSKALTQAETKAGKGLLRLRVWREKSKIGTVVIKLPVLGSYSATAPFDCDKSSLVIDLGCKALADNMQRKDYRPNPIVRSLNALSLLASGDKQYMPLIKREVQWAADLDSTSFQTWYYGYTMMLVSEYILETGDVSVMPGLERQVKKAVEGQSAVGSWGHRFANDKGQLLGYGMMHAPGVPLTISMVLAKEAGAKHQDLDLAIERSLTMIRFYVNKGSIPYGDHAAWIQNHDDNGKNGMAAVLFNLLGDKEAAEYFSRMAVACYGDERDTGHTGNFLNILWALPSVAQSGPHATGVWMEEFGARYLDMARQHDGTFIHQGPAQTKNDSYRNWDSTGGHLLALTIPRNKLRMTSLKNQSAPWIERKTALSLIEDGRGWNNIDRKGYYQQFTTDQLVSKLTSWSPVVRDRAATVLRDKSNAQTLNKLIAMLGSSDESTRYGACLGISRLKGDRSAAVPKLMELFESKDLWTRVSAAQALAGVGDQARVAAPMLLTRMAKPDLIGDPRGMEQRYLTKALFAQRGGLLGQSVEGIDRDQLMEAVRVGLKNQDGRARGAIASVYQNLSFDEIRPLLPAILDAIEERPPSGIMFADGIRMAGLDLLSKHHVEQGMDLLIWYAQYQKPHASQIRVPVIMSMLERYGAQAQPKTEALQALSDHFDAGEEGFPLRLSKGKAQNVRDTIEKIRQSTDRPELIKISNIN